METCYFNWLGVIPLQLPFQAPTHFDANLARKKTNISDRHAV